MSSQFRCAATLSLGILVVSFLFPIQVSAETVWNEEFNVSSVEALDDWILQGYELTSGSFSQVDHGFTIVDGELRAEDVYVPWSIYLSQPRRAIHNSTVVYGTWSFDWRASESQDAYDGIEFMFTDLENNYNLTGPFTGYAMSGYTLIMDTVQYNEMYIEKFAEDHGVKLRHYYFTEELTGQYHLDITRDIAGEFNVYLNNELVLSATDNDVTTCETFNFVSFQGNSSIDNVVISDSVDVTTSNSNQIGELVIIGTGIGVVVLVIVIFLYLKKKSQ